MNRRRFIKNTGVIGLGLAAAPLLLQACRKDELNINFSGKVIIIGAGSAGMMAAYRLKNFGIDFEIIEASGDFGGRVKMHDQLADFPIDLGAEWIHSEPNVFSRLIDDSSASGEIDLIPYQYETIYFWKNGELTPQNWTHPFYGEYKFKSTTWYQFFEEHIIPEIQDKITYNSPVTAIDHSEDQVHVSTQDGNVRTADRAIITVPLNILKDELIEFDPALPATWLDSLALTNQPPGIKAFLRFSEKFYPDAIVDRNIAAEGGAERLYYDAAFKKDSDDHVLALFTVGDEATFFTDLDSDQEVLDAILGELDLMFDGQASALFIEGVVQNWEKEPWIRGSYSFNTPNNNQTITTLNVPINGKLFFAGEALYQPSPATVHGAGFSGIDTAERVLLTE